MSNPFCVSAESLKAYRLGQLPNEEARAVAEHLERCPDCEAAAALLDERSDPLPDDWRRAPESEEAEGLLPLNLPGNLSAGSDAPSTFAAPPQRRRGALWAAVFLVIGIGFCLVLRQWHEAASQKDQARLRSARDRQHTLLARQAVDNLLALAGHDGRAFIPPREQVRQDLLEEALQYYEEVLQEESGRAETRAEAGWASHRSGAIAMQLGKNDRAEQRLQEAINLLEPLSAVPQSESDRSELAGSRSDLGVFLTQRGRPREAIASLRQAVELLQQLRKEAPESPQYQHALAKSLYHLAGALRGVGEVDDAGKTYLQSLELEEKLTADFPKMSLYRQSLALIHNNIGQLLESQNRPREAETAYGQAIDLQTPLTREFAAVAAFRDDLARYHTNRGLLRRTTLKRPQEAEADYQAAASLRRKLADDFPRVPSYRDELGRTLNTYGLLLGARDAHKAEEAYLLALPYRRQLSRDFPAEAGYHSELAAVLNNLAGVYRQERQWQKAVPLLEEAVENQQSALKRDPGNATYRQRLYDHYLGLAGSLGPLGNHAELSRAALALARVFPERWQGGKDAGLYLTWCQMLAHRDPALDADHRQAQGLAYARQAKQVLQEAINHKANEPTVWYYLALMEMALGDAPGYQRVCRDALEHFGSSEDSLTAHWVSRTCSLAPAPEAIRSEVVDLAARAVRKFPDDYFCLAWYGAALYRAGRYQEALQQLEAAAKRHGTGTALDRLLRALAHQRLRQTGQARQCLETAGAWLQQAEEGKLDDKVFGSALWYNQWLELRLLRQETEKTPGAR